MLHQATCQPPSDGKPGYEFCAGQHWNPNMTWWEQSPAFFSYLARCSEMLQHGKFAADVCFYLGEEPPTLPVSQVHELRALIDREQRALAISPDFRGPPPQQQIDFAIQVLEEDRQMCELQVPREVPLNPTRGGWGVLVMPGDTLATIFQKQLRRWLLAGPNQ